jgi:immunity protein, SdpI family
VNRRRFAIFSAIVVGAMLVLSGWAWLQLPADAQVPIHWGVDGQADGYASKTIGLFLMPLITVGVAALFWIIPVIEPRRTNIEKSGKAYSAIAIGVMVLLAAIDVLVVAAAMGADFDMTVLVFGGVGALFIVIGNYLPKVRSNYLVGIRTPWTLTSERSWDRTHRLGGRLFVIEGIILILLGLFRPSPQILTFAIIAGVTVLVVIVFAYSYRVWKADPARREV